MEINSSMQLGFEQALKALIPHLRGLDDPDDMWDFLDVFPATNDPKFYYAGHEAEGLPEAETDYVGFVAELPRWRDVRQTQALISLRVEIATGGLADETTRAAAVVKHSQRTAALVQLFHVGHLRSLLAVINAEGVPWAGIGFNGWQRAADWTDGNSPSGNTAIARAAYTFATFLSA